MQQEAWILERDLPNMHMRLHRLSRGAFHILPHSHRHWQIIVVTEGELAVSVGGETIVLYPGMIHILPPDEQHSLESGRGYSQLGIDLYEKPDSALAALLKSYITVATAYPVRQSLEICRQVDECRGKTDTPLTGARIFNLVESLVLSCMEAVGARSCEQWVEELTEFLDRNLDNPLCVGEIAAHFYMSVPQLERRCHQACRCGVAAWLQQRRFYRAKQLLINTDESISQIGAAVGYPDAAHFSGFFRRHAGVSPRTYRQQHQQYA